MSDGHVLTLTANEVAMIDGTPIQNGDGTSALAYDISRDPHGILGKDGVGNSGWYAYQGGGSWASIPEPSNMVVVTDAPPPPPPGVTFTGDQWTAIQAAFAAMASDAAVVSADVSKIQSDATALNADIAKVQSDMAAQNSAWTALKTLLGL
jgi:hypothetical protein